MKKVLLYALIVVALPGMVACARPVSGDLIKSDKERVTSFVVDEADLTALVDGNNVFAFNLYQGLRQTGGNLFYSPYSISEALAMTYAGARGGTEKSIAEALNFTLSQ